ncbi:MAG: hypothetical protein VX407_08580 [Verrucomicrobiota bacterium]|nr:hypothetical protein [Verrucomicrobiota bacterium]
MKISTEEKIRSKEKATEEKIKTERLDLNMLLDRIGCSTNLQEIQESNNALNRIETLTGTESFQITKYSLNANKGQCHR